MTPTMTLKAKIAEIPNLSIMIDEVHHAATEDKSYVARSITGNQKGNHHNCNRIFWYSVPL